MKMMKKAQHLEKLGGQKEEGKTINVYNICVYIIYGIDSKTYPYGE